MQCFDELAQGHDGCSLAQPMALEFARTADEDFEFMLPFDLAELLADDFQSGSIFPTEPVKIQGDSPCFYDVVSSSSAASAAGSVHSSPAHDQLLHCSVQADAEMQLFATIVAPEPVSHIVRRTCTRGPRTKVAPRIPPPEDVLDSSAGVAAPALMSAATAPVVASSTAPPLAVADPVLIKREAASPPPIVVTAAPACLPVLAATPLPLPVPSVCTLLPPRPHGKSSVSPPVSIAPAVDDAADMDSDDSDDTDDALAGAEGKQTGSGHKRKAPEVDWRSITDPAERRRQRRLAKNRVTAARSRERKKVQWADMEQRFAKIEGENARLRQVLEHLAAENGALKSQLHFAAVAAAAAAASPRTRAPKTQTGNSTEPAVLIFIATLLLTCCFLSGDKALLLGTCVPLLLAAILAAEDDSADGGGRRGAAAVDALLRFLLQLRTLLARSGKRLRKAVSAVLFGRRRYLGRQAMHRAGGAAAAWYASAVVDVKPGAAGLALSLTGGGVKLEPLALGPLGPAACLL